ncbi:MAG: alpha-2-macroglobulin [Williamsia sp.]|nr:alpha-2-macroglobulin [Williamsia sp.]
MWLNKQIFFLILLSLVTLTMQAQNNSKYDTLWKKADELISKKGLPKSALAEVEKIYTLAKKEGQQAQLIKALVYKMQLSEQVDEDAQKGSIQLLDKEILTAAEPVKSILTSLLAERYLNYFQQHRYQLYNRTQTQNFQQGDIATWSINDLHAKIGALYLASIEKEKLLQQTALQSYDPIIIKGNMRALRPTLYDLLAHKALDYFRSDERDINKPAYAFELKEEGLFSDAATFAKLKITTADSLSLHRKALLIFQQLLQFHAGDTKPDALIDADLLRIEFVHQYAVMPNKDDLYAAALKRVADMWGDAPAAAQAWYLIAQEHAERAGRYEPFKDTTGRYEYLEAVKICERILKQGAESEGKVNCFNLLNQIQHRDLSITTETVNIPEQPFRALVQYRNFTQLYFRIIPLTDALKSRDNNDDAYWKQLIAVKPIRSWSQVLPATNDYQKHSAEIKVDALPVGSYVLIGSLNENFFLDKNPLAAGQVYVSNISYVNRGNDYFLLHRETGKPLAKATVQVWYRKYDYSTRRYTLTKGEKKLSNENGFVQLTGQKKQQESTQLEVTYNADHLFGESSEYIIYNDEQVAKQVSAAAYEKDQASIFFFTDRSIYRPGQTVYFKGIIITKDFTSKRSKAYPDHKAQVALYNANGEKIDSLELTTNEFGSYSGKFRLPENGLTGEFYIREELDGQADFSVEEYKRPRFSVEYEPIKEVYKVNDSIAITGSAQAYAGNNIDGAQVKYRVVRQPRFIYPWLYGRWLPRGSNLEITSGIATTDAGGKFTIRFKAIPDLTISKQLDPVFDYKIIADVTDVNGETRSGEKTVLVSYKALQIKVATSTGDETVPADSLKSLLITTQNINGDFQPSLVRVSIFRLQSPDRLIRERYWQQPDQFVMNQEEFTKYFPADEYKHESDYHTWGKGEKVWEANDSTRANGQMTLKNFPVAQGSYIIEAVTTDRYGEEVKAVQFIQLYDDKSNALPVPSYSWDAQRNKIIEPGETSTVIIGSSASDLFVIQQIDSSRGDERVNGNRPTTEDQYRFISLNKEKKSFNFIATENDRGGFGVYNFFVKNNRFYSSSHVISVPWTNKELSISYETFRDKTLPGSEERWKVKISGYKNEKVAVDMLASMYDASLDQFKPHSWNEPNIWPTYFQRGGWSGRSDFGSVQMNGRYFLDDFMAYLKSYDQLLDLGFENNLMISGVRMGAIAPNGDVKMFYNVPKSVNQEKAEDLLKKLPGVQVDQDGVVNEITVQGEVIVSGVRIPKAKETEITKSTSPIQPRKNFAETAFFFPNLHTDAAGNIEFSFTMPEALTRWKFQALAHTKEAAFGYSTKDLVTQKQLMVQPNVPRFLREGDHIELSTKIVNLTGKELTGTVHLELLNAATLQPVDGWFQNMTANQYFTAEAGKSVPASFTVQVPYQYTSALVYRFTASVKTGNETIGDGEEASLPVLKNSMLVTESVPLPMRGNAAKNFRFDKLLQSGNSETLQHFALTVEYTGNPVWYAVQALPYLTEYPYECAEQTFNRLYANALASKVANASPRLKRIFDEWNKTAQGGQDSSAALLSNLQKNQELKSLLLEETPWVLQAKSEAQQKKNIALLFDMDRMSRELQSTISKLQQFQLPNGGFPWFRGDRDDRFITQYIITGIGHLRRLGAWPGQDSAQLSALVQPAIQYLDKRIMEDYQQIIKSKANLSLSHLQYTQIQYLYMRSFFPEYGIPGESFTAVNFFRKQTQQYWLQQNKYMQGMIALALNRTGDVKTAQDIIRSLQQNATVNEEMGMYWKEVRPGYYWYQAPIETQSLLIEAFSEISKNKQVVSDLTTWLLKQKQTQNWRTTKATADACYAILLQSPSAAQKGGSLDQLNSEPIVEIKLGDKSVKSTDQKGEAGTGYFKKTFEPQFINASMGDISVKIQNQNQQTTTPSWGAVYWQYFENLDKITQSATALQINKKLFIESNSDRGPLLQLVTDGAILHPGTKIKVRIELRADRDMEYVHLKDMRASCMEPVNVLSSYKWQGGLGYYESTRDASTNFFFSRLPKGSYVFEYSLFVTHTGNFSNGITTAQCMYAPEFTSHSEGVRVNVE